MNKENLTFSDGLNGYVEAIGFIFFKNLWYYFFIPLILNILLFIFGFQLVDVLSDYINEWINSFFTDSDGGFSWLLSILVIYLLDCLAYHKSAFYCFFFHWWICYNDNSITNFSYSFEKTASIITGKKYHLIFCI